MRTDQHHIPKTIYDVKTKRIIHTENKIKYVYNSESKRGQWRTLITTAPIISHPSNPDKIPIDIRVHHRSKRFQVLQKYQKEIVRSEKIKKSRHNNLTEFDEEYITTRPHIPTIHIATDGYCKNGQSSCAYIITSGTTRIIAEGGYNIPTHPLSRSSFDAETHGVLGIIQELQDVLQHTRVTSIIIHIDNKSVVKILHKLQKSTYLHHHQQQYDTFLAIQQIVNELNTTIYYNWIRAHQKITTDIQKLNALDDNKAKGIRCQLTKKYSNTCIK